MRNLKQRLILGLSILAPVVVTALIVLATTPHSDAHELAAQTDATHSTS